MDCKNRIDLQYENQHNCEKFDDLDLLDDGWEVEYVPCSISDNSIPEIPEKYKRLIIHENVTEKENTLVKWKKSMEHVSKFDIKYTEPVIEKDVDNLKIFINGEITYLKIDSSVKILEIVCHYNSVFKIQNCQNIEKIKIKSSSKYSSNNYQTVYINNCPKLDEIIGANFIVETKLDNLKLLENKGDYPCEITLNSVSDFCDILISSFTGSLTLNNYKPDTRISYLYLCDYSTLDINFLDKLTGLKTLYMYMVYLSPDIPNFIIKNKNLEELAIIEDLGLPSKISCPLLNKLIITTMGGFDVKLSDLPIIDFPSSITSLEFYIPSYSHNVSCSNSVYDESLSTWSLSFSNLEKLDIVQKDPLCIEYFSNSSHSLKQLTYRNIDKTFHDLVSLFPYLIKDKCHIWGDNISI